MKKLSAALFSCLFLLVLFTGCGNQISFTWMVDHVPANLDPQLAASGSELTAVTNLYSGLVRLNSGGEPQPECAQSWEISNGGLTYTFYLKPELTYTKLKHHEEEYSLTAKDFVFAFQRIYQAETESPYTGTFSAIRNSLSVLAGQAAPNSLGVSAPDDYTVVFQLDRPDPEFLAKLALPGAMPCNESFFNQAKGAYGLAARGSISKNILANGPFRLYNWNENGLFLRRSGSGSQITSLRMVLNATGSPATSDAPEVKPLAGADLVTQGKATAALSDSAETPGYASIPYTATTWALTFNTQNPLLAAPELRQALAACIQDSDFTFPAGGQPAQGLVPPAVTIEGKPYRELVGNSLSYFQSPVELCRAGLSAAQADRFSDISLIMPAGHGCLPAAEAMNQQWQKQLGAFSAFFSLKELPPDEFYQAVATGNYQIALVPFSPVSNSAAELLSQAAVTGISIGEAADALASLQQGTHTAAQLAQIERTVLAEALVVPLWYQSKSLTMQPGVDGLVFRPFGPVLDLTWASYSK